MAKLVEGEIEPPPQMRLPVDHPVQAGLSPVGCRCRALHLRARLAGCHLFRTVRFHTGL